jgi:hypothetical protein
VIPLLLAFFLGTHPSVFTAPVVLMVAYNYDGCIDPDDDDPDVCKRDAPDDDTTTEDDKA